jgi:sec-independent protein translocase protein TatB
VFNLDPSKLLIIAVVAVILLGPDRLPTFARQVGGAWRSFTAYRHRMEAQVRESMPDLPSSAEITRLARSPAAFLDHLSTKAPDEPARLQPEHDDGAETPAQYMARSAAAYRPAEPAPTAPVVSGADPSLN